MMDMNVVDKAWDVVRDGLPSARPKAALVLGSGWNGVDRTAKVVARLPYTEIPGLGRPGVGGHEGELLLAVWEGRTVLLFKGRRHWYEGAGWEPIVLPVILARRCGVSAVLLTNAAGGIREDLCVGDFMVIRDHINGLPSNPLVGPPCAELGPRFPDQTEVYDRRLCMALEAVGASMDRAVVEGVYVATSGPTYETPAEVAAFRTMGADAVGMSTVPEAMVANAMGLRVAAVSCITNRAAGAGGATLSHQEVMQVAGRVAADMERLVTAFVEAVGSREDGADEDPSDTT